PQIGPALHLGKVDIVVGVEAVHIVHHEVVAQIGADVDASTVRERSVDDVEQTRSGFERPTGDRGHHVPVGSQARVGGRYVEDWGKLDAEIAGRPDKGDGGRVFVVGCHRQRHQVLVLRNVFES